MLRHTRYVSASPFRRFKFDFVARHKRFQIISLASRSRALDDGVFHDFRPPGSPLSLWQGFK